MEHQSFNRGEPLPKDAREYFGEPDLNIVERIGDYEGRRRRLAQELADRARVIQGMDAIDQPYLVPIDPMDDLGCEGCQ